MVLNFHSLYKPIQMKKHREKPVISYDSIDLLLGKKSFVLPYRFSSDQTKFFQM